ncbi:MAG: maltotransferase domain-containing protein, partial [Robiginitalea sp.]|nr:maltotransferase domain-containing protein [Robiginitalea sp.]
MFRQERVVIDDIRPQLDCGKFFIKRVLGESVSVSADILPDGHDVMQAEVLFKHQTERKWREARMRPLGNDRWEASFSVDKQGFYQYKVRGWVDYALNWQHGIEAKIEDGQHVRSELLDGVQYLRYVKSKV